MSSETEIIDNAFEEAGLTLPEYIERIAPNNLKLLNFNSTTLQHYKQVYSCLKKETNPKKKGALLEKLTHILFHEGYHQLLACRKNIHTSTNEIDLQIEWTLIAHREGFPRAFDWLGDSFICECKNYSVKVGVTYVGKFYSLLSVTRTKLGIMIAWEGVTGKGKWSDSQGLIKKIALRENVYIIVIDKNDLYRIYNEETNIFALIRDKYMCLKTDIDYGKYIESHPAEQEMIKQDNQ